MPRDVRRFWDDSRTENAGEHLVPACEAAVTQASNEFCAAEPKRAGAVENQSPDGVRILSVASLNRDILLMGHAVAVTGSGR